jgi:thiol-disulfide isomerase/thioredoxin
MNSIERFLLDSGLSWTMSKLLPYILMVFIGLLLVFILKRFVAKMKLPVRLLIKLTVLILPFVLYFAVAPIYQGDFSNNSVEISKDDAYKELTGKRLVVLTIPGCPYCLEALGRMKKLKERVPAIEIDYIVCHTDPETMDWYKQEAGDAVNVKMAENIKSMSELAFGVFPTFVLVDGDKTLRTWSNDNFGVSAMDEIELNFN